MNAEIGFVLSLARALHRFGTPAHRLEEAIAKVCRSLGLEAEVFTTPTAIVMSFGPHHELRTRMMRVEGGELDMGKLAQVDALGDLVIEHQISPEDASARLAAILAGAASVRARAVDARARRDVRGARGVLRRHAPGRRCSPAASA